MFRTRQQKKDWGEENEGEGGGGGGRGENSNILRLQFEDLLGLNNRFFVIRGTLSRLQKFYSSNKASLKHQLQKKCDELRYSCFTCEPKCFYWFIFHLHFNTFCVFRQKWLIFLRSPKIAQDCSRLRPS